MLALLAVGIQYPPPAAPGWPSGIKDPSAERACRQSPWQGDESPAIISQRGEARTNCNHGAMWWCSENLGVVLARLRKARRDTTFEVRDDIRWE